MKLSKGDRQRIKTAGVEAEKLRHVEKQKRQGWLDELKGLAARQGLLKLEEVARVDFILRRIIQESKLPQSLPWPYRFTEQHLNEIKKFPGLLWRFNFFEQLCFHQAHGEMLVDAKAKALGGDDGALIRLIEWNPLVLCEEWVRDRVAEAIWKGEKSFLNKVGKAFLANKRLRSKMKQRGYRSRLEHILLNCEWLGLLENSTSRKEMRDELLKRLDGREENVIADDSTYFKLLRAARVYSGREKLSVKS